MLKEILILGIGGDGVQLTGNFLMNASIKKNYNVSFYPIYGSQMRGGESTLVIKLSDEEIVNPMISKPDVVAIVNDTHIDKYKSYMDTSNNIVFAKAKTKNKGNYHTGHLDNRLNSGAHIRNCEIIDLTKSNIVKNKNIILLAKLVKMLLFITKEDIYEQIVNKFKKVEVRDSIKKCFDMEYLK